MGRMRESHVAILVISIRHILNVLIVERGVGGEDGGLHRFSLVGSVVWWLMMMMLNPAKAQVIPVAVGLEHEPMGRNRHGRAG